ncbi:MAG: heme-degrading domain-containing protein [Terracidiphilus sp.]|nr:heme-degrading domain-containing protein [Terracidiphilus sp.]
MGVKEDLEQVVVQERELRFKHFDAQVAWELGTRLRTLAVKREDAIVIDVRRFGQPLFYAALEGTTPDNVEWVRRKNNIVSRYHRSSYGMGLQMKLKGETLEQRGHSVADFAAHGGAFPIVVEGAGIVGSVTVSGLPQRRDHELVIEALCSLLGKDYSALKLGPEN